MKAYDWKMKMINSKEKGFLETNRNPRYHYLEFPPEANMPPSVIDFKHYFSVTAEYLEMLKKENFICRIGSLYREAIFQRFAYFLSRIGLPDDMKAN